jgi:hypothetical protein
MKSLKYISLVVLAVVFISCGGNTQQTEITSETVQNNYTALENFVATTDGAAISFNEKEFEFPEMEQGESVSHSFYFVNSGDAPLVLTEVKGSCGCTGVEYPKDPILPGEKGKIDAEVSTATKSIGHTFKVKVYVSSNAKKSKETLALKGTPIEPK